MCGGVGTAGQAMTDSVSVACQNLVLLFDVLVLSRYGILYYFDCLFSC